MHELTEIFCLVDDFCQQLDCSLSPVPTLAPGAPRRGPKPRMAPSEMLTILVLFHQMRFRDFKSFYNFFVLVYLRKDFPKAYSYTRFVAKIPHVLGHAWAFLGSLQGKPTGISFVDSTALKACRIQRVHCHRVFKGSAQWGKTSVGWFFGLKLHLVINDRGELLSLELTPGNTDDRVPLGKLTQGIEGKLFGDKGYISSSWTKRLRERGLELITPIRKKMKPKLIGARDAALLRKRGVVEAVIDQLKNISQIEHSRHRSPSNFLINLVCGLIAYCLRPTKPSLARQRAAAKQALLAL